MRLIDTVNPFFFNISGSFLNAQIFVVDPGYINEGSGDDWFL
jgi:hypothetical protein